MANKETFTDAALNAANVALADKLAKLLPKFLLEKLGIDLSKLNLSATQKLLADISISSVVDKFIPSTSPVKKRLENFISVFTNEITDHMGKTDAQAAKVFQNRANVVMLAITGSDKKFSYLMDLNDTQRFYILDMLGELSEIDLKILMQRNIEQFKNYCSMQLSQMREDYRPKTFDPQEFDMQKFLETSKQAMELGKEIAGFVKKNIQPEVEEFFDKTFGDARKEYTEAKNACKFPKNGTVLQKLAWPFKRVIKAFKWFSEVY